MFGFLKEKLKSWLGTSKKEVEEEEKEAEKKAAASKKEAEKGLEKVKKAEKKIAEKEKKIKEKEKEAKKKEKHIEKEFEKEKNLLKKEEDIEAAEKEIEIVARDEDKIEKIKGEIKKEEEEIEELEKEIGEDEGKKLGFFQRLKQAFTYTLSEDKFEEMFSELELLLLESNVALEAVERIKADLKQNLVGKEIKKEKIGAEIQNALKNALKEILINPENLIEKIKNQKRQSGEPFVILFFGINGAGKTTSIAKIGNLLKKNSLSYALAAADTFRAASIEQLQIHADKLEVDMVKQKYGSDPSAVAFDAVKYAKANSIDVVLIDTAGRMHTKENLLHEMEKICRVSQPNLKVFVAEAIAGNDAVEQAKAFNDMIGIDGSILSKVDVDEKGGTIVSISYITKKPILYLGTGQNYEDIELFDKEKFIERLGL